MTEEKLKMAEILIQTIRKTKAAIESLEGDMNTILSKNKLIDNPLDDKMFWLTICQHKDGSGFKGELNRYGGNVKLLEVIIEELKRQLVEFEKMFDEL